MCFKSQKNDLASFQYLENFGRFSKHLKPVLVKSNTLNPKMDLIFESEYFFSDLKK